MSIDDRIINPQKAIKEFVDNHKNPDVKKNYQTISQMAAELDGTIKDKTTLKDFKRAVNSFLNTEKKSGWRFSWQIGYKRLRKIEMRKGLYANIHAKRKRGGKMRKKGAKGAPTAANFKRAKQTARKP